MRIWLDIIEKVVSEFNEENNSKESPGIKFFVSSAFVPKNTTEPSKLVLTKQSSLNSGVVRAASNLELYSEEDNPQQDCNPQHPYL